MTMPNHPLFSPLSMPPRDKDGMCCHPDLLTDRWNMDDNEEAYDRTKFAEAGFEVDFIEFEYDAPEELQEAWCENGDANCSAWQPSRPAGEGWMLAGIWDHEDGPLAFYVRPLESSS